MGTRSCSAARLAGMLGLHEEKLASYFRAAYAAFRAGIAWYGQNASGSGKPEQWGQSTPALRCTIAGPSRARQPLIGPVTGGSARHA
jgi:hypothetical protein